MAVERLATSIYTNARNGNLNSEETKKKVGEAAVGTSAAAAAGRKAGFSMFKSSSKVGALSGEVVDKYAEAFSGWVQKAPVIGKIVKTSLFAGTAKCLGFGLAVLTLVTGLTNIATNTTAAYDKHIKNSKFLNSLDKDENSEN